MQEMYVLLILSAEFLNFLQKGGGKGKLISPLAFAKNNPEAAYSSQ
jgi:hypothetical protein